MATALEHLKVEALAPDELDAALECARQIPNLEFKPQNDYEVCSDNKGLETASKTFMLTFAPWFKVSRFKKCHTLQANIWVKPVL